MSSSFDATVPGSISGETYSTSSANKWLCFRYLDVHWYSISGPWQFKKIYMVTVHARRHETFVFFCGEIFCRIKREKTDGNGTVLDSRCENVQIVLNRVIAPVVIYTCFRDIYCDIKCGNRYGDKLTWASSMFTFLRNPCAFSYWQQLHNVGVLIFPQL